MFWAWFSHCAYAYDLERAWFKPHLTVNKDPELCGPLLETYTQHFLGNDWRNPLAMDFSGTSGSSPATALTAKFTELKWQKVPGQPSADLRYVDYRVGGEYYAVVREHYAIGWREGYSHQIIVNQPIDTIQLNGNWHEYIDQRRVSVLVPAEEASFTYESTRNGSNKAHIDAGLTNILESSGSVYFLFKTSGFSIQDKREERYGLYRAQAGARMGLVCEMKTEPSAEEIRQAQAKIRHLDKFKDNLKNILGEGGDCGTLNSHARAKNGLHTALEAAAYRPWLGRWEPGTVGSWEMVLSQWQYYGLWNYKIYAQFLEHKPKILAELSEFYLANYTDDPEAAAQLANKSLNLMMAVFSGEPRSRYGSQTDLREGLLKNLLTAKSLSEFQKEVGSADIDVRELDQKLKQDGMLVFALGRVDLMQHLIARGADVDKVNAFGKTPLMYAAQYNDLASAKLLIESGADLNASTDLPTDTCQYTLRNRELTALHYAVRYASVEFIDLLLKSGSSIHARDSSLKTPYDYLTNFWGQPRYDAKPGDAYGKMNPFLSESDYRRLEKRLRPAPEARRKKLAKKENREGEKQYQSGDLVAAQGSFKRSIMLDPSFFPAHTNLALTLLKRDQIYASAKTSAYVASHRDVPVEQKASANFNLGLACERYEALGSSKKPHSAEFAWRYCRRPALNYFFAAYEGVATDSRRNKILQMLSNPGHHKEARVCQLGASLQIVKDDLGFFFIGSKDMSIPYTGATAIDSSGERSLDINSKQKMAFGENHSVERWKINLKNNSGKIRFEPGGERCGF